MVGVRPRHRRRAGSVIIYHDRDASTVAAARRGRRRVQLVAAHGARGVFAEPRVDARRVERVAAHGEQAHGVARGELRQADGALGLPRRRLVRLLEPPHRGERGEDRGVQTGRFARRVRVRRGVGGLRVGGAEAAPAAQPEGEEVEEVAQEEDGEEAEEEHEEDEHGQQHRERLPRRRPRRGARRTASAVVGGGAMVVVVVGGIAEEAARGRGHDRVHGRMGRGRRSGAPRLLGVRVARGARGRGLVGRASSVCSAGSGWREPWALR